MTAMPMHPEKNLPPSKEQLLLLEPFVGLGLEAVHLPTTPAELEHAWRVLTACEFVGFDTEARPTFDKGAVSSGPDVVQFATASEAFVFQLHHAPAIDTVMRLLVAPGTVKAGFGLWQDQQQLQRRLGVRAMPLLDLDLVFRRQGYPRTLGVKGAIAVVFGRRLVKSRKMTTSNWSSRQLKPNQLLYAANDAYAALRVLQALDLARKDLPVWADGQAPQNSADAARD